jgi:hypothetical protein
MMPTIRDLMSLFDRPTQIDKKTKFSHSVINQPKMLRQTCFGLPHACSTVFSEKRCSYNYTASTRKSTNICESTFHKTP